MKIIALFLFKNETPFIPTCISSIKQVTDEIIAIDDDSEDDSADLLRKEGVKVYKNNELNKFGGMRTKLFELGRQHSGTHFVCLDADEAFTNNFILNFNDLISKLPKGYKYTMQWLAMWKSLYKYKNDHSVWSNNFKDFILHDDGRINYKGSWIHEPRLPTADKIIQMPVNTGAVFHFQFSCWKSFQIKQAWYRCLERISTNKSPDTINNTYKITLDDSESRTTDAPSEWYIKVKLPILELIYSNNKWRLKQIKEWFEKYGIKLFENLDIWHIKELKQND